MQKKFCQNINILNDVMQITDVMRISDDVMQITDVMQISIY